MKLQKNINQKFAEFYSIELEAIEEVINDFPKFQFMINNNFANKCKVSHQQIARIISGVILPEKKLIDKILKNLNMEFEEVFCKN